MLDLILCEVQRIYMATGVEIALIAGAIAGTVGAIQQGRAAAAQGQAEQDILNFNAAQKIKEAEEIRAAASEEAAKFARKAKAFKGAQRVAIARGGVLATGTPALLLEETAQELEADRLAILEQGFLRGEFAESQAFGQRFAGTAARARGRNIRRGSLLTAGGIAASGIGATGLAQHQLKTET
jgi:hypothetical protein